MKTTRLERHPGGTGMLIRKNTDQASGKLRRRLQRAVCLLAVCLLLVQTGMLTVLAAPAASVIRSDELRGVWISDLDWEKMPADQEAFKREVDKMLDRCVELKMNAVFVHVRPDADAMYPSSYFPWSRFVTGTQGHNPGYDPFAIFVKTALYPPVPDTGAMSSPGSPDLKSQDARPETPASACPTLKVPSSPPSRKPHSSILSEMAPRAVPPAELPFPETGFPGFRPPVCPPSRKLPEEVRRHTESVLLKEIPSALTAPAPESADGTARQTRCRFRPLPTEYRLHQTASSIPACSKALTSHRVKPASPGIVDFPDIAHFSPVIQNYIPLKPLFQHHLSKHRFLSDVLH